MARKLYLETFGCQMNVLDSELVLHALRAHGYEAIDDRDRADVIIYNTCSVREHAEQKVWSRLGELRQRKQDDPSLVIGVIGCMAERDGTNLFRRNPHVDILCGPGELDKLPALVHNAVSTAGAKRRRDDRQIALMGANVRRSSTLGEAEDSLELLDLARSTAAHDVSSQAYVRITRGCNKFCTYCVVPYTRGPEVHRPPENIVEEVRRLTESGAREVTLLGQTINHYAYQHGDGRVTTFADLLYLVHEQVPDLPRLRFVTSFPRDFTDQALQAMRDCDRICHYLHAPAQHGSDRVLKLMNRGYTVQQYREFAQRAREMMPDVCIASDFIVGFPTETEPEFEATCDLIRWARFKNSFIFKYSPRPGTVAIKRLEDDVPDDVKRRRNNELLAVQNEVSAENNRQMVGKQVRVLVESLGKQSGSSASGSRGQTGSQVELGESLAGGLASGTRQSAVRAVTGDVAGGAVALATEPVVQVIGRTMGDQIVAFDAAASAIGQIMDVRITGATTMTLFAERVQGAP